MSRFEARWLAEVVRRHEDKHGLFEDRSALAAARQQQPDFEQRILIRAQTLPQSEGWREGLLAWRGRLRLLIGIVVVLAALGGYSATLTLFDEPMRVINVMWALGALLGASTLLLLWWLAAPLLSAGRSGSGRQGESGVSDPGWFGQLWLKLMQFFDRSPQAAALPAALPDLLAGTGALRWGLGALSHALWTASLGGAWLALLIMLMGRSYSFSWETTILPNGFMVWLVNVLGQGPALLGLPLPDVATINASAQQLPLLESGRQAWAGWLLGVVLLYGVLPRLLLCLWCVRQWHRKLAALKLNLSLSGYARLRSRLLPESERIGVTDPAPRPVQLAPRPSLPRSAEGVALVALEIDPLRAWPCLCSAEAVDEQSENLIEQLAALDLGRVDSRGQRRALLDRLRRQPPRRLLLALESTQLPDRGVLAFISELIEQVGSLRIYLLPAQMGTAEALTRHRLQQWREAVSKIGLDAEAVLPELLPALVWLGLEEVAAEGRHEQG